MAETMKLLPCPFCGGDAEFIDCSETDNRGGRAVSCTNLRCEASSNVQFGENSDELLAERWNTRATTPMMDEELAAVLEDLEAVISHRPSTPGLHYPNVEALLESAIARAEIAKHRVATILSRLPAAGTSQSTERDRALEEAAKYHDVAAADCRKIAEANNDNDLGRSARVHAADHEIAAHDIRAMKTSAAAHTSSNAADMEG